jgi:hypothetical protein
MKGLLASAAICLVAGVYFCVRKGEGFDPLAQQLVFGVPLLLIGGILLITFLAVYMKQKMRQ